MGNMIGPPVPTLRVGAATGGYRHNGSALVADPAPRSHAVQFYDDDQFLLETVARFLAAGLSAGDRIVVIATAAHRADLVARLEPFGSAEAIAAGRMTLLDAGETLSQFMVDDHPAADRFHEVVAPLLTSAPARGEESGHVRAYGEMVDVLWRSGKSAAAIRLEELWNDAQAAHSFELLCAYAMGNFYREGAAEQFIEVCRTHTHVMPTERLSQLGDANAHLLREVSLLQQRADALESEIRQRKELEAALRDALRERNRVADDLRASLERERHARELAEASDQFKEVFLGILGHDLRNPLSAILTTVRLMVLREELADRSRARLERVLSSGVRMERMVEQLLDFTRARLAEGIPVGRRQEHDLGVVAARIVDELRSSYPRRTIELRVDGPCPAFVDADRFEQVVSNFVGNALAHGDALERVEVSVDVRGDDVCLGVHNHGPAIDPELVPFLFDPFKRGPERRGRSAGLGLGLYISERIVSAHRGRIEVTSSVEAGTRFEAILPRRP